MTTPKQEKLVKLLLENLGTPNNTRTLGDMMREAGYSESQAKNPFMILETKGVQEGLAETVKELEELRDKAITELRTRDLSEEEYKDIVKSVDTYIKNVQLLSGKETERQGITVNIVSYGDNNSSQV